jgi:hypothetical protein
MSCMTGFMKRGHCLAAVAVFLFVTLAVAADMPYVISEGIQDGLFSVSLNGRYDREAQNVSIDSALSVIRIRASEAPVEIRFDTTGGGLDLGKGTVVIERRRGVEPDWGVVTLSGSVRSSAERIKTALILRNDAAQPSESERRMLDVKSSLNIKVDGDGNAVKVEGRINLKVDSCALSTMGGFVIYALGPVNSWVTINGGTFKSKTGWVVSGWMDLEVSGGTFESEGNVTLGINGPVRISGGKFSSAAESVLECRNDGESTITGGLFTATKGGRALGVWGGKVYISGSARFSAVESDANATIVVTSRGKLVLAGGFISNKQKEHSVTSVPNARAISIAVSASTLTIVGDTPPEIVGSIVFAASRAIQMDTDTSWRSHGTYILEPIGGARVDGVVAVVGGGPYADVFKYTDKNYEISRIDKDIVMKLKPGVRPVSYVITGDTVSGFMAVRRDSVDTIGRGLEFEELFGKIREHSGGKPCSLYLGIGNVPLNIGGNGRTGGIWFSGYDGNGWGRVTLLGEFLSRRSRHAPSTPTYGLWVLDGASVENYATINTIGHVGSVFVIAGSDYTHAGGTLDMPIFNGRDNMNYFGGTVTVRDGYVPQIINRGEDATLIVAGGTIGDTASNKYAVKNYLNGEIFISGSARIISADTGVGGGTIVNDGVLEISGGSVSNVKASKYGTSIAINNGADTSSGNGYPTVEISKAADVFSQNTSYDDGVISNNRGKVTILGGNISNRADTIGAAIVNNGTLVISDPAETEPGWCWNYNTAIAGAVYSHYEGISESGAALTITGGTITVKDKYAVYISGAGGAEISGDAEITTPSSNGAVYIGPNGYLYLYGGKVSSLAAVDGIAAAKAIEAYRGNQYSTSGRLEMCGNPIVNGIISLPGGDDYPMRITPGGKYRFDPDTLIYRIAMPARDGGVAVENGAGFIHNFVLDTAGNAGLNLAVNGDNIVTAKSIREVSFSVNGSNKSTSEVSFSVNGSKDGSSPASIPVMTGGTIGESAKPPMNNYALEKNGYIYENDGKWYLQKMYDGVEHADNEFGFGGDNKGTHVFENLTLTLSWTGKIIMVSVLESTRDLPLVRPSESAAVSPVVSSSGTITAGPSPAAISAGGAVNFFRSGAALKEGKLFIYDASGNVVTKIILNDNYGAAGRRSVAKWDLRDAKGRQVAEGTYVARGVVTAKAGKRERVSVLINVQR